jgi:hypothetical protein
MIYYKALKLKNGELMACSTDQDITTQDVVLSRFITVNNPVVFNSFKYMDNEGELVETISMMPMIPIGDTEKLEISADHIFSISTMLPGAAMRYETFLEHLQEQRQDDEQDLQAAIDETQFTEDDEELLQALQQYKHKMVH